MKNTKKKAGKISKLLIAFIIIALICGFLFWQNNGLSVSHYEVKNEELPTEFDGYTIVQISDLHSAVFGRNNDSLLNKIERAEPDIIVITGDIVSSYDYEPDTAVDFVRRAAELCDVYFVSGNHEERIAKYPELKRLLAEAGAIILENEAVELYRGAASIVLAGIPCLPLSAITIQNEPDTSLFQNDDSFNILLAHEPQYFEEYRKMGADLIFSGHAHGGQIRLPFVGGLYAPGQGFFPKYTSGVYEEAKAALVVSRGLGNSLAPFRIFNRPEIVVVRLKCS